MLFYLHMQLSQLGRELYFLITFMSALGKQFFWANKTQVQMAYTRCKSHHRFPVNMLPSCMKTEMFQRHPDPLAQTLGCGRGVFLVDYMEQSGSQPVMRRAFDTWGASRLNACAQNLYVEPSMTFVIMFGDEIIW